MTHHITDEQIGQIAEQVGLVGPASRVGYCHAASLRFARAVLALAAPQGQPVAYRIDYPGVTDTVGLRRWCGADEYASFRQTIEFLGGVFVPLYTAPAPAVPSIDYMALIDAALVRHKYAQGTRACVAFKHGAEWFREQALTAAPTPPAQSSREAREAEQRARMNARHAARAGGAATADFDLPAPNDVITRAATQPAQAMCQTGRCVMADQEAAHAVPPWPESISIADIDASMRSGSGNPDLRSAIDRAIVAEYNLLRMKAYARELRGMLAAAHTPAERYRWLRDMASQDWLHRNHNYQNLRGAAFDAAIDAARAAGGAA